MEMIAGGEDLIIETKMAAVSSYKKDLTLTQDAFDKVLRCLDQNRERAGEKYERIRFKLTKLFKWRGCVAPEDLTDQTIDRAARRIDEGADLNTRDPYLYFHGIALNMLREYWKRPEGNESLENMPPSQVPHYDAVANWQAEIDREEKELRLDCLDSCLRKLSANDRDLVGRYHHGQKRDKIEARRLLADSLNIPLNALRIRVYRIRATLEKCIEDCVGEAAFK
jgi:DNA-directed RNA polymerase specialized sigma24 family protein